jgi:hypothetical protein
MVSREEMIKHIMHDPFMNAYFDAFVFTEEERLDEEYAEWCEDNDIQDQGWSIYDLSTDTLLQILKDCRRFMLGCEKFGYDLDAWGLANAGHDFWLTRNHHGTGFWDRKREDGEELTDLAQQFPEVSGFVLDNGQIGIE